MKTQIVLLVLAMVSSLALDSCATNRESGAAVTFRAMTYNIHHGEGLDRKVDLLRIAELIKREGADIVALQEVDKGVERTGRRDLPGELAALTGMTCVFSNNYAFQGGEYGNAVLTRFPVLSATNTNLKMLHAREPRGLQQLVLEVGGHQLRVFNTHLDAGHDDAERWSLLAQVGTVIKSVAGKQPVLLCGDFNATPETRISAQLNQWFDDTWKVVGQGNGCTIPSDAPHHRIDYLWSSKNGPITPLKAWVPVSKASDHLPVVAEFRLR
jgi:endonuclease/exonuclease/phosphatase family metal-dependent hydrolase